MPLLLQLQACACRAWRLAASGRGRGTSFTALTDRRGPGVHMYMWGIVHQTIVSTVPTLNVFYSHTLKYGYHARASDMVNTTLSYDRTAGLPCAPPTSQRGPQIARSIMRLESGGRDGISVASQLPTITPRRVYVWRRMCHGESLRLSLKGFRAEARHSPLASAVSSQQSPHPHATAARAGS